jgi:hypothetical protein
LAAGLTGVLSQRLRPRRDFGRTGDFEYLHVWPDVRDAIARGVPAESLKQIARTNGYRPMGEES